jgi:inner membrane protein
MDNITHSLVGLTLAETGLKRLTPLGTATLIIGANFPDIDIVTGLFGQLFYLEQHRGLTHSLIALPFLSLLLAALMFWYSRRKGSGANFGRLSGLGLLAMMTHPLLDYLNSYGWRPLLPWNHHWYYGDIAFVIDPWLWVFLGGTAFIFAAKTRRQLFIWSALFVVTLLTVFLSGGVSLEVRLLWLLLAAVAAGLHFAFDYTERTARRVSVGLLVALLAYFGALAWLHRTAIASTKELAVAVQARDGGSQIGTAAMPTPADPLKWRAVIATDKAFYLTDLDLAQQLPSLDSMKAYRRETGDATVIEAARRTAQGQTFLRFARFPVAEVITSAEDTLPAVVEIRDVRFQDLDVSNSFVTRIILDKNLRPLVEH